MHVPRARRHARGASVAAALAAVASLASADVTVYTLDADFDQGVLFNVDHDVPDQLQLSHPARPYPYLWVAASERGTIVKIHVETGAILGEYLSSPDGMERDPSRTTVDRRGNAWVGNRAEASPTFLLGENGRPFTNGDGSITKVGLLEAGQCVDRNGNGVIDTSHGLGDVLPWTNAGDADRLGGVTTAADECILRFVRTDPAYVRQVSIDRNEHVWAGGDPIRGSSERKVQLFDGDTGAVLRTIDFNDPADTGQPPLFTGSFGPGYGGFVDCHGHLWSAAHNTGKLVRVDPSRPNGDPQLVVTTQVNRTVYGLGHAPDGTIWSSTWLSDSLIQFDDAVTVVGGPYPTNGPAFGQVVGGARGVAVSPIDGDVWVANSGLDTLTRHRPDGSVAAFVPVGVHPTAVAIDTHGKVWTTNRNGHDVMRIDPATNAVDLVVDLRMAGHPVNEEASPYNYSDMTGSVALLARPFGRWSVVTQAPCEEHEWRSVAWTGAEPAGTHLLVEARSADTPAELETVPFQPIGNGAPLTGTDGALLETRVSFLVDAGATCEQFASPVLFDLTVTGETVSVPVITCPADRTAECGESLPAAEQPLADDPCGTVVLRLDERTEPGTCGTTTRVVRRWTATNEGGDSASCEQVIDVLDTQPPVLSGVPADVALECGPAPPPPAVSAADLCAGDLPVAFGEVREDGPCARAYRLVRTWSADDGCGHVAQATQVVDVSDTEPPALAGVPADDVLACGPVPPPPSVTATDLCAGALPVDLDEAREDGPCEDQYRVVRTWSADDGCGNAVEQTQVVVVSDTQPPTLSGVPADLVVECADVPAAPAVTASDSCDPAPRVDLAETTTPGRCPNELTVRRVWTARDRCGNAASDSQVVEVRDTTPPVVTATHEPDCLWPPNHRYYCVTDLGSLVEASDACPGPVRLSVVGCDSDQPDDQKGPEDRGVNGDGDTTDDCVVASDASGFCVRSERLGQCKAGRTYGVAVRVADDCGNAAVVVLGIHVPHDQREHPDCAPQRTKDLLRPNEDVPFAWTPDPDPDAGLPHPFACP